jgi:transcription antitermination protein NusB
MSDSPELIPNGDEQEETPVMDERTIARRIALQALYEIDAAHHPAGRVIATHLQVQTPAPKIARYVRQLVIGVLENLETIDAAIVAHAPEFPVKVLAIIDRNILRIAIYEFAIQADTPVKVACNEAVELAKMFGADGASSFINGVLGAITRDEVWLGQTREDKDGENGDSNQAYPSEPAT